MKYEILIERDEDGVYCVSVPALPGCFTQGTTREEARANAREAIQCHLESLAQHGDPIPAPLGGEVVEVSGV